VSWTTDQVLRRLVPQDATPHDWLDPSGKVCLVEFPIPPVWCGKKLVDLNERRFQLSAVTRVGIAQVAAVDLVGQEGDMLHFVAEVDAIDGLRERLLQGPLH
jgi:trk system potassium uptake protein TrkA